MAVILVEGRVLDARGQPVAGARVSWRAGPVDLPDISLLTDAQGRFALAAPTPGHYELRADSDTAGSTQAAVDLQGPRVAVDLRLPG